MRSNQIFKSQADVLENEAKSIKTSWKTVSLSETEFRNWYVYNDLRAKSQMYRYLRSGYPNLKIGSEDILPKRLST